MRNLYLLALALSVLGLLAALFAFLGPLGNTGVDGTLGAGLALVGTIAVGLMLGILAARSLPRGWFIALNILAALAALLTFLAAFFLMQTLLAFAMAATLVALVSAAMLGGKRA